MKHNKPRLDQQDRETLALFILSLVVIAAAKIIGLI